jgi:hypothetical protein
MVNDLIDQPTSSHNDVSPDHEITVRSPNDEDQELYKINPFKPASPAIKNGGSEFYSKLYKAHTKCFQRSYKYQ